MKHVVVVLLALGLLLAAGCDMNGLKGGVSLEVGNARYATGSTIDAGIVSGDVSGFDASKALAMHLVNETDRPLTITPDGTAHVVPTYGQYVYTMGSSDLTSWESGEPGWLRLAQDISSATIPAGGAADFEITFDCALVGVGNSTPDGNYRVENRQGYKISLGDGETSYDFVFEVYGVVAC